jgi:hypothetical protein
LPSPIKGEGKEISVQVLISQYSEHVENEHHGEHIRPG